MERDANLNLGDKLARKESYDKRDIEHKIFKLKDAVDHDKSDLHMQQLMSSQKLTYIKFEINHDIMWRAYYKERLVENNNKLKNASNSTKDALSELIKNDKERINFYYRRAKEQYAELKKLKVKANLVEKELKKPLASMISKISLIRLRGEKEISR